MSRTSPIDVVWFAVRQNGLRLRRAISMTTRALPAFTDDGQFSYLAGEFKTPLWTDASLAEMRLQVGKVQNLRVARTALDGVVVGAGQEFSFWAQLGRCTRSKGYVEGRELREGCLIPAIGGGLCQLSNSLYDLALKTDCTIIERHAHSQPVPGSASETARDATVAWNYIDLRFSPRQATRITVDLTSTELIVRFWAGEPAVESKPRAQALRVIGSPLNSCGTCGDEECARHAPEFGERLSTTTAYVLNASTPEFAAYVAESAASEDALLIPIDGQRRRLPRYAWPTDRFAKVDAATVQTLSRSVKARLGKGKPPATVRADQMRGDRAIARVLATKFRPEHLHLVVSQSFLPFLWDDGHLAGRTFDVLMERLPLHELQECLDTAFREFPEQTLLGDFRADPVWVEAERRALLAASRLITPHPGVAQLFGARANLLSWNPVQPYRGVKGGRAILFPGPTAARKGAYAVREVARRTGRPVILLGTELEGADFWRGVETIRGDWGAATVALQPSISEDRPISLLRAQASRIPVVATAMCGLETGSFERIDFGDVEAMIAIIERLSVST